MAFKETGAEYTKKAVWEQILEHEPISRRLDSSDPEQIGAVMALSEPEQHKLDVLWASASDEDIEHWAQEVFRDDRSGWIFADQLQKPMQVKNIDYFKNLAKNLRAEAQEKLNKIGLK